MAFRSILFGQAEAGGKQPPGYFKDLNLDQIVESITSGRDEYDLKPFFEAPLSDLELVKYRYQIFRDLESRPLLESVRVFAQQMQDVRAHLAQIEKLYYDQQKQFWFLDAVDIYCSAIVRLTLDLRGADLRAHGLLTLRDFLITCTESGDFTSLTAEIRKVNTDLARITYSIRIDGNRIRVSRYGSEPDYSADVLETFERFRREAAQNYHFTFTAAADMNHVEAAILDFVGRLNPDVFQPLTDFYTCHQDFLSEEIRIFDREVQFYVAYIEHMDRFKPAGLSFCHPAVSDRSKEIYGREIFDLALAGKLVRERSKPVTNEFYLKDPERILVVSGPNQGGKTTFARTFGQLHYLASIGCPVPAAEARLFLCDRLFTHFEREEDIRNLSSKLEDDLLRVHRILKHATPRSILIMNESFLSTSLTDAVFLSTQVMRRVIELDMLCVSVTFLDELAALSNTTVSMVSTVNTSDPAIRTFKVVRRPADGRAYAVAIADKYRLGYSDVRKRIMRKS